MNEALLWLCSPRPKGVTDTLASWFAEGLISGGVKVRTVSLRDYPIQPCAGCGACGKAPHSCIFGNADQADALFELLRNAPLNVFASPIYFYALPAHFKAFIDRGQRFWARGQSQEASLRPALAIMAAGRPRGEKLFTGALRTLRWFLKNFAACLAGEYVFRGLEQPEDLLKNTDIAHELRAAGRKWSGNLN